jgi:hypothetical protein
MIALPEAIRALATHIVNLTLEASVRYVTLLEHLSTNTRLGSFGQFLNSKLWLQADDGVTDQHGQRM